MFPKFLTRLTMILIFILLVAACAPVATQASQAIPEPATPTPEVFHPLDPSPTPSGSTFPLTCQATDLGVYVNEEWGYCFAYPANFTVDQSRAAEGIITLYSTPLEANASLVRASLEITTQVVSPESRLTPLVEAYSASFDETVLSIERETETLGGKPAETLNPVPGLLSSRVTMALHEDILFTLRFHLVWVLTSRAAKEQPANPPPQATHSGST